MPSVLFVPRRPPGGAARLVEDAHPTGKHALFDLDGTLVTSASGRLFAPRWDDCLVHPEATSAIRKLQGEGYSCAIVTNQSSVRADTSEKMQSAADHFGIPVFAAMGRGCPERKPSTVLWAEYTKHVGADGSPPASLIYCGDAAGAQHSTGFPPYEWSDSDYQFSVNIGAEFRLPHELMPTPPIVVDPATAQVVILVGMPGVGKTKFAKHFVESARSMAPAPGFPIQASRQWVAIEKDSFRTKPRAHDALHKALAAGTSAVFDATHPSRKSRTEVINIARAHGATPRIIWLPRGGRQANSRREKPVPVVAYSMYTKHYEDPRGDGLAVDIVM
jgi:bifunctional polynucleotide phosphatase/kinase